MNDGKFSSRRTPLITGMVIMIETKQRDIAERHSTVAGIYRLRWLQIKRSGRLGSGAVLALDCCSVQISIGAILMWRLSILYKDFWFCQAVERTKPHLKYLNSSIFRSTVGNFCRWAAGYKLELHLEQYRPLNGLTFNQQVAKSCGMGLPREISASKHHLPGGRPFGRAARTGSVEPLTGVFARGGAFRNQI